MFLDLPDPDPSVRDMDLDLAPDPSIKKISKKNILIPTVLRLLFMTSYL
jgi:hypothetical protein